MRLTFAIVTAFLLTGCGAKTPSQELHAAAAANLQRAMEPLTQAFEKRLGVHVVASYGSSAVLAQQIENGGPFDIFLSADTAQVDKLTAKGLIDEQSRANYARGVLVVWAPKRSDIRRIEDLGRADVKRIAIANPELAPYGKAAIETLTALHLWPALEPKVVYGPNISIVAQFADGANADASFTALSLVNDRLEKPLIVPDNLHQPIDQSLGIVKVTPHPKEAAAFREYVLSAEGQGILAKFGYRGPR